MLSATNWLDALDDGNQSINFNAGLEYNSDFMGQQNSLETPSASSFCGVAESPTSPRSDRTEICASYVNGQSSRPPHVKKGRLSRITRNSGDLDPCTTFALTWRPDDTRNSSSPVQLTSEMYNQIVTAFHRLCLGEWVGTAAFVPSEPPPKELLEHLIHRYWEFFDPIIPFLHEVLNSPALDSSLGIAMCAIGSHYTEAPTQFVLSMHEWTRRTIYDATKYPREGQYLSQVRLLYYVCSTYYSATAQPLRYDRSEALRDIFLEAKTQFSLLSESSNLSEMSWHMWSLREQVKRLACSAWLLDAMHATHSQTKPTLRLEDLNLPLPCEEQMWQARTSEDWQAMFATKTPSPKLHESLQQLYIAKRLPRDRGEFARILMIHGLYHHLWDVSRYHSNQLFSWEPTDERQEVTSHDPIWLPSIPAFSKWQNSTCDALDILHWQANATIGQQSGFEHPTVLHLHFARVVLLAPCEHILTMAKHSTGNYGIDEAAAEVATQQVRRWAVQHQFKARLAAVHAGVLFWHVRHHSADAFYEPPVMALATLTLWAFGTFARAHVANTRDQRSLTASTRAWDQHIPIPATDYPARDQTTLGSTYEDGICEIILLDRPTDDELVQQFIRHGHKMQAHITGVGDLYSAGGPSRVLRKGYKLVETLRYSGGPQWLELLQSLVLSSST